MNLQETIEFGIRKIVEQGKRCSINDYKCSYEYDGNRCVMGHILAEKFRTEMLGYEGGIHRLTTDFPEIRKYISSFPEFHDMEDSDILSFWYKYQSVHDNKFNWENGAKLKSSVYFFLTQYPFLSTGFVDLIDWTNIERTK